MSDTTVLYESKDNFAEITLNRPDRLNAFTKELHADLWAALDRAGDEGARAILITGAGRGFCAGQDLRERGTPDPDNPLIGMDNVILTPHVASATTRLTRPISLASPALTRRPVKINSLASAGPIRRGRRWVPPMPGSIPRLTSGKPKVAFSAAILMSQASATSHPPPRA